MPRLAIVITAIGSIESLEGTLVSVLEHRPEDSEVLVALNQPYADPYQLQGEVNFVQSARGASHTACTNAAVAVARSPFVHLLTSGCEVTEGWTETALARFGDRRLGAVAPWVADAAQPEKLLAAGVGYTRLGRRYLVGRGHAQLNESQRIEILGPAAVAGFYRKAAWEQVHGLCESLELAGADVDLALGLAACGYRATLVDESRVIAPRDVEQIGSQVRHGLSSERLFWRNAPGAGRAAALLAHGAAVAGELVSCLVRPSHVARLAARAWACCEVLGYARRRRDLAEWAQQRSESKREPNRLRIDAGHPSTTEDAAPSERNQRRAA